MFCGSCMHDNTLVRALNSIGCDATLLPTYTPIRTDETSVAVDQVFFGGINVFLQQKIPLFRWLPNFLDQFLNRPRIIQRATARSLELPPSTLGKLAVSMLQGKQGRQRKEVRRLVHWLQHHQTPDVVMFTNLLIGGCLPAVKEALQVPVIVTLQGDDVFLDSLPEHYRQHCLQLMRRIADHVDAFLTHSDSYRLYMSDYLGIEQQKIHVTPLGLDTAEFENWKLGSPRYPAASANDHDSTPEQSIGYLARLAPEKGLHVLVDAFIELAGNLKQTNVNLKIAGWLGREHQVYADQQFEKLDRAGLGDRYQYLGSVDRQQKLEFLHSIDVFSVPATFFEPKGLYALEALAAATPVVLPDHGAFPELIGDVGGGELFPANQAQKLAAIWQRLLADQPRRQQLGLAGQQAVWTRRNAHTMAESTLQSIQTLIARSLPQ